MGSCGWGRSTRLRSTKIGARQTLDRFTIESLGSSHGHYFGAHQCFLQLILKRGNQIVNELPAHSREFSEQDLVIPDSDLTSLSQQAFDHPRPFRP